MPSAPTINPSASNEPAQTVAGINMRIVEINSSTPTPILPHGSMPIVEKINTDSSEAVNLKYSVCTMMMAAINRAAQNKIPDFFILRNYSQITKYPEQKIVIQMTERSVSIITLQGKVLKLRTHNLPKTLAIIGRLHHFIYFRIKAVRLTYKNYLSNRCYN